MGNGMTPAEMEKMAAKISLGLQLDVFMQKAAYEEIYEALKSVSASATESAALKCSVMARMAGHENLEKIIKKEFSL